MPIPYSGIFCFLPFLRKASKIHWMPNLKPAYPGWIMKPEVMPMNGGMPAISLPALAMIPPKQMKFWHRSEYSLIISIQQNVNLRKKHRNTGH